jgi:hypothetical protein
VAPQRDPLAFVRQNFGQRSAPTAGADDSDLSRHARLVLKIDEGKPIQDHQFAPRPLRFLWI